MENNKSSASEKLLRVIPGVITWTVLLSPIILARPLPLFIAFFITFVTVFWVYRALMHSVGMAIGYRRYLREKDIDWYEQFLSLDRETLPQADALPQNLADLKHLVITPVVNESEAVLGGAITGVASQTYPLDKIFHVITVEEKYHKQVRATVEHLKAEHPELKNIFLFVHPSGLTGEIRGAASNRTWGATNAVAMLEQQGYNLDDFVMTTMDGDAVLGEQYLARLSFAYATQEDRKDRFYQTALYLTNNNIWDVPTLMRIQANSVTLATLSGWVIEPFFKETFSNFSLSLRTLMQADYWDKSISIDDTTLFWRIFNNRHGRFRGVPLYVPVSSDAVQGKSFIHTHKQQYKQLVRWGWGIITFPMAIRGLRDAKNINSVERLLWVYRFLERYAIWYTIIVLITFGFPLIVFVNPAFKTTTFSYLLPKITSTFLTLALLFLIPAAIFRQKLTPPMPKDWSRWKRILIMFEGVLVIIHLFTYVFLPFLQAQTQFMFGKNMERFEFTPKYRKKSK